MGRMIKAYSRIITKNIALFLAAGFLNLLFSENGWFPDDRLSRWSGFLSEMVIPLMLAYGAGQKGGEAAGQPERKNMGGAAGVLAAAGLVSMQPKAVILSAAALGAAAGYLTVWLYRRIEKKLPAGFEMIAANGTAAGIGLITAAASLKLRGVMLLRIGAVSDSGILAAAGAFLEGPFLFLSNLLIEPLKVLFLNNGIHHGVLIPLGMEQMKTAGRSALFLIESNPGPGLGVLLAFWAAGASLKHGSVVFSSAFPERRASGRSLLAQAAVEFFGGIHEVYFPYVLADLRLLAAVMAGGCSGTLCFSLTRAGLFGPASPGSMLSLLLLSPAQGIPGILLGVGVSAAVSFGISLLVLRMRKRPAAEMTQGETEAGAERKTVREAAFGLEEETDRKTEAESEMEAEQKMETRQKQNSDGKKIRQIYVVCDAGLGSSAMGAALFRRTLREAGADQVKVSAAAADEIPADGDLLVCQKDFYRQRLQEMEGHLPEIYPVDSLTGRGEYALLLEKIKGRL